MTLIVLSIIIPLCAAYLVRQSIRWSQAEREAQEREARRKERVLASLAPVDRRPR